MIIIGAALRLERPRHDLNRATQSADHFSQHMILFEIERIGCDLAGRMAIADMPRRFQKAQRILSLHFHQSLRRGFDEDERAILQLHRVAIVQHCGLVEIKQKGQTFFACQGNPAAMSPLVVKAHRVNNPLGLHSRFTNNRGSTLHQIISLHGYEFSLEQKIALRHGQFFGRLAYE
jgi:hypothetical protein